MAEPLVSLRGVTKRFTGVKALDNVSLDILPGEVCCLVGENGSGKSTLIKMLSGMYRPDVGAIVINGVSKEFLTPAMARQYGFQFIYQDFSLLTNMTVAENVAFSSLIVGRHGWYSHDKARKMTRAVLDRMGVDLDPDTVCDDLLLSERQLVAIAAALARDARLIVMDEPTTALSRKEVNRLLAIISTLKSAGVSVIFVSHKLDEVASVSDHTVVIRNGRKVSDLSSGQFDRTMLVNAMTGRDVTLGHVSRRLLSDSPVVLQLDKATRQGCFRDVDLTLRRGEIVGITGLLGSGRESLALALFGLLPITSGSIRIGQWSGKLSSPRMAIKHGIGYVPEDRLTEGLFLTRSIASNVAVRTVDRLRHGIGLISQRAVRAVGERWSQQLTVKTPNVANPVSTLSGGNQQRVVLAKWLSGHPKILILNGPTVGVDIGSKSEILDKLRSLADGGMAVIVISDDIPELIDVSDRIIVMREGSIWMNYDNENLNETTLNELLVEA